VLFPLGRRPADDVANEIKPLLGPHVRVTVLPQTRQLLVMTTAGKMRVVSAIISSIPEPRVPKTAPNAVSQPATLAVYATKNMDAKAAVEMIQTLLSGVKTTVDEKAGQINLFATADRHEVIRQLLAQMSATADAEVLPRLEVYQINHESPSALL
jgi:hypothetical protein